MELKDVILFLITIIPDKVRAFRYRDNRSQTRRLQESIQYYLSWHNGRDGLDPEQHNTFPNSFAHKQLPILCGSYGVRHV